MLRYAGRTLTALLAFDFLVVVGYQVFGWTWLSQPEIPLSMFGGAIGVLLGFRNTSSYQRWWEARTLWGAIVNASRSLARQATSLISNSGDSAEALKRDVIYFQIAYVHALRCHLRGQDPLPEIAPFLPEEAVGSLAGQKNVPFSIQNRIAALLAECYRQDCLNSIRWTAMEETLTALMNAQGGCERIKNTPLPRQYDYFPQLFVRAFCVLLPLGMVSSLGWLTPIGSALVGFIFLALDATGRELEDPFANTIHDVPMTAITRTIEINLRQHLGETELPSPVQVQDGVVW